MPIVAGKVTFSKTIQAQQFEPKKAEVEVSFTCAEGENFQELLDEASLIARDHAFDLVGTRKRD